MFLSDVVVRYRLSDATSDGTFAIDSISGEIRTIGAIDREMRSVYRLTVLAGDSGHLFTSGADVIVRVVDVNDNRPTLLRPAETTICVGRTTARGRTVGRVAATDLDAGSNAEMKFRWINHDDDDDVGTELFQLSEDDGHVIARTDVCARVGRRFRFRVTVEDLGVPARSAVGTVSIVVNDTCAVADREYTPAGGDERHAARAVLVVSALLGTALGVGVVAAVCARRRSRREVSTRRRESALGRGSDACRHDAVRLTMQHDLRFILGDASADSHTVN